MNTLTSGALAGFASSVMLRGVQTRLASISLASISLAFALCSCSNDAGSGDEVAASSEGDSTDASESDSTDTSASETTGIGDLPAGCEQPTTLASGLSLIGEFPSDPWSGGCSVDQASFDAGRTSLVLTCSDGDASFPLTISVPAEQLPSGVGPGLSVGVTHSGDHSDEFLPVQTLEVDDIDGLILASTEASLQDAVFKSITLSVASDCAEVGDPDSAVAIAAGYVHAKIGQSEADIEVGGVATLALAFEWDVYVTEATAIQCCHGNQLSATIVRR